MTVTLRMVILLLAVILFLLAGLDIKAPRVNLLAIGLVFLTVAEIIGGK